MAFIEYDAKTYRNQGLFPILRAYILYHVGVSLTPNKISCDLKGMHWSDKFKASDVTVTRYLEAMESQNEIVGLTREYVKTGASQNAELSFGKMYYLTCSEEDMVTLFRGYEFQHVVDHYDPDHEQEPDYERMVRQTLVCQRLLQRGGEVRSGAIIYHYCGTDKKDHKVTVPADFVVEDGLEKTVLMLSGKNTLLPLYGKAVDAHVLSAILSLKRFAKVPVKIVAMWDREPVGEQYGKERQILEAVGHAVIPWNEI